MRPSLSAEMTKMLESATTTSKNEFFCQTVEFLISYLLQRKNIDYLSPILACFIRDEVESVEKIGCEISKSNGIIPLEEYYRYHKS